MKNAKRRVEQIEHKMKTITIERSKETSLPIFVSAVKEEEGASAVEYALLVALIATVIFGTVAAIGPLLAPGFTTVVSAL